MLFFAIGRSAGRRAAGDWDWDTSVIVGVGFGGQGRGFAEASERRSDSSAVVGETRPTRQLHSHDGNSGGRHGNGNHDNGGRRDDVNDRGGCGFVKLLFVFRLRDLTMLFCPPNMNVKWSGSIVISVVV